MNDSPANKGISALAAEFERLLEMPEQDRQPELASIAAESPELARQLRQLLEADRAESPLDGYSQHQALALFDRVADEGARIPYDRIGPYQVLGKLGEGGMGQVFLASRDVHGYSQHVAIKVLRGHGLSDALRSRFLAEQRNLARLDHPAICRFIAAGFLDDGAPYVVMEAVDGLPMLEYCEARRLGVRERVQLLRLLLEGVAHAHERLLVHRDIKPANVLVTHAGQPKLLDFGISKALEGENAERTCTSERFFTPSACAPEQLLGVPSGVACDLYSFGALAFEVLGGQPPLQLSGLRASEIEARILTEAPPLMSECAPAERRPELAGDLDAVIDRCLRKTPADRYPNAPALDADLERWLEHRPVLARGAGRWYRARLFLRRNALAASAASLLIALALSFGTTLTLQSWELDRQRLSAIAERDRALLLREVLEEALGQADPSNLEGAGVTVRDILEAVVARMDALRPKDSELFVALAETLARVEFGLGSDERALMFADQALDELFARGAHVSRRRPLHILAAKAEARRGRFDASETHLEQATAPALAGDREILLAEAQLNFSRARYAQAEQLLMALIEQGEDEQDARVHDMLVQLLALDGRLAQAIELQEKFLVRLGDRLGADHRSHLVGRLELLRLKSLASPMPEDLPAAFATLLDEIALHFGGRSVVTARAQTAAARARLHLHDVTSAVVLLRSAAEIYESALGEDHARTLRGWFNVAQALLGAGDPSAAEPLLATVQERVQRALNPSSPFAITVALRRSHALALLGRYADAQEQLEAAAGLIEHRGSPAGLLAAHASTEAFVRQRACSDGKPQTFCRAQEE